MKLLLSLFVLFSINHRLISQINIDETFNDAIDIIFNDLQAPIHKVDIYDTLLWSTDYGNGMIFKSLDKGRTFKEIATLGAEYFEVIQFLNEKVGFVCGDYGFVYKTMDGGQTWTDISPEIENRLVERFRNDSTKNQAPDGQFAAYYSMHFSSENEGFVSGFTYNPKTGFRNSYKRLFYSTDNGGVSWSEINKSKWDQLMEKATAEIEPFSYVDSEYFVSKDISWRSAKNRDRKDILIKRNYKAQQLDTLLLPMNPFEKVMLRSIVFISQDIGFVFGGSLDKKNEKAIIYSTTDAGRSWKYHNSNLEHIHVAAANDEYLFIFGKNQLMKRVKIGLLLSE